MENKYLILRAGEWSNPLEQVKVRIEEDNGWFKTCYHIWWSSHGGLSRSKKSFTTKKEAEEWLENWVSDYNGKNAP